MAKSNPLTNKSSWHPWATLHLQSHIVSAKPSRDNDNGLLLLISLSFFSTPMGRIDIDLSISLHLRPSKSINQSLNRTTSRALDETRDSGGREGSFPGNSKPPLLPGSGAKIQTTLTPTDRPTDTPHNSLSLDRLTDSLKLPRFSHVVAVHVVGGGGGDGGRATCRRRRAPPQPRASRASARSPCVARARSHEIALKFVSIFHSNNIEM